MQYIVLYTVPFFYYPLTQKICQFATHARQIKIECTINLWIDLDRGESEVDQISGYKAMMPCAREDFAILALQFYDNKEILALMN